MFIFKKEKSGCTSVSRNLRSGVSIWSSLDSTADQTAGRFGDPWIWTWFFKVNRACWSTERMFLMASSKLEVLNHWVISEFKFGFFVQWHIYLGMLSNAKAILLEEQLWYYLTYSWEDKGVHTFPNSICPKVNVIARLEFELAYYDSAVHRFNLYHIYPTPPLGKNVTQGQFLSEV